MMDTRAESGRDLPPWPASLPPAPGELRVVQAFVNTRDIEEGTDELDSPAALGAPLDPKTVEILDGVAEKASLRVGFGTDGIATLQPAVTGWEGALARLLQLVVVARIEGLWPRLKACPNDECNWAFYDFSKNRSSKWCTMKRCGNLMNARAYRRRRGAVHLAESRQRR
jgi:hypothetical protein